MKQVSNKEYEKYEEQQRGDCYDEEKENDPGLTADEGKRGAGGMDGHI